MINVEQNIIGCILLDSDYSLYHVYERLKPEMFQYELTRDAYVESLAMYDIGEKVNVVSLIAKLENNQRSKDFVQKFLISCLDDSTSSAFINGYVDILEKEYKSREIKNLIGRIDLKPNAIDDSIAELYSMIESLKNNEFKKAKSLSKIVEENKDNYFKEDKDKNLIKTGFYHLDDCLGGLEGGDVTVIGARPAVGKSAIVTQIIGNMALKGHRIGYFNLEMNENQVYERFMARQSQLSLTRIRRAKTFLGGEEKAWNQANESIKKLDVMISTGGKTISQIRAESRHQNFDVIVIDYLQLVKADKHYNNRASEVGAISWDIKSLAMELNIPIILLSQLNRVSEGKETKEPTMAELRESGNIEQDASNIILLWNLSQENTRYKGLKVEKQRQGTQLKEGLEFIGDNMEFRERQEDFKLFCKRIRDEEKSMGTLPQDDDPFAGGLFK